MRKFLSLIAFSFSFSVQAIPLSQLDMSKKLNQLEFQVSSQKEFKQRVAIIDKFKKSLEKLADSYGPKDVKAHQKNYYALATAKTALSIVDFDKITMANCSAVLTELKMAYDPQSMDKPRLPRGAKDIFNILAKTCKQETIE